MVETRQGMGKELAEMFGGVDNMLVLFTPLTYLEAVFEHIW